MSKKIKILYLIGGLGVGGAEDFLLDLTTHMDKEKFDVTVCCIQGGGKLIDEFKATGINIITLSTSYLNPLLALKLTRLIKKLQPEIIHTYKYFANASGRFLGKILGVPIIIVSEVANDGAWHKWYHKLIEKALISYGDMYVVDGLAVKEYYQKTIGIAEEKIRYINTTVNDKKFIPEREQGQLIRNEFQIPDQKKIVGFIGRFTFQKGPTYFLEAAAEVLKKSTDVKFIMVGYGDLDEKLRKMAQDLGIERDVIFTGLRRDLEKFYNAFDILINSSTFEGLPLVIMQAMLMKNAVIASDVDGNAEIIKHGQTGILVPPKQSKVLADAIVELLKNEKLRQDMGERASELMRSKYALSTIIKEMENLYQEMLA